MPQADTYVVCLDCGDQLSYDWNPMRIDERIERPRPTTCSSVITSKPAIGYHFKTGQRNQTQDQVMFYGASRHSGKSRQVHCRKHPGDPRV